VIVFFGILTGVFFAAACVGWSLVITGNRLLADAEQRAKDWEQRAGEAARDTLAASLYSRVALPAPTTAPDVAYDYDDTGLVRTVRPPSSL
jgi:hypothetical protein